MSYFNYYINKNKNTLSYEFANTFYNKEPVFMCIGNSNVVADCFGPIVGELLSHQYGFKNVYGTLENNITEKNLESYYKKIKQENPLSSIVVVDATIGEENNVGLINFFNSGCIPAATKNNQIMGDFSLLATVNVTGIKGMMFLKTVKFNMILQMASFLCDALNSGFKLIKQVN